MSKPLPDGSTALLGNGLSVATNLDGNRLTVRVGLNTGSDGLLHWGLSRRPGGAWQQPPETVWPQGTRAVDGHAVRTPFSSNGNGEREVVIHFDLPSPWQDLPFVVFFPRENRWLKSGGKDFSIALPRGTGGGPSPGEALAAWVPAADATRPGVHPRRRGTAGRGHLGHGRGRARLPGL
jgi:hypothetical protein